MVERFFAADPNVKDPHAPLENHPDKLSLVQLAIRQKLEEQGKPRFIKFKIRAEGPRYRYDKFDTMDGALLGQDTPYNDTQVTGGDRTQGIIDDFSYMDNGPMSKTAFRYPTSRKAIRRHPICALNTLDPGPRLTVQSLLSKSDGASIVIDPSLVTAFTNDTHPTHRMRVRPFAGRDDEPDLLEFLIYPVASEQVQAKLVLDKTNFLKVRYFEVFGPQGKVAYSETRQDFDANDFPRSFTSSVFDAEGRLVEGNSYAFTNVVLNEPIARSVFEFNPPQGFVIHDARPTVPTTTYPDGKKERKTAVLAARQPARLLLWINLAVVCGLGFYVFRQKYLQKKKAV
jgi:hypothetical protein